MLESAVKNMVEFIDNYGNALASLCSNEIAKKHIGDVFGQPVLRDIFSQAIQTHTSWDALALHFKRLVAGNFLRLVQFSIYADDIVEESELDVAYLFLKPLVYLYSVANPARYKNFENLERSDVKTFLYYHIQETGIHGGNLQYTHEYVESRDKLATLSDKSPDFDKLMQENIGASLAAVMAIMPKMDITTYADALAHVSISILSDGVAYSHDTLRALADKNDARLFSNFSPLERFIFENFTNIQTLIIQTLASKLTSSVTSKLAAQQIRNAMTGVTIPTISHFPPTCFVGKDFQPAGNVASPRFHLWCQHCGAKLEAKEKSISRSLPCPKCQQTVLIERNQPPQSTP